MAKAKRDKEYYDTRLKILEKRKKKLAEEEKKAKEQYREWKVGKIVQILEENTLLEIITEDNLEIFEKHFKSLADELKEIEIRRKANKKVEKSEIKEEKIDEEIKEEQNE